VTCDSAAAVGVLIATEVLPVMVRGTGSCVIIIIVTIIVIIAIITKETPHHQIEEL